MSFIFVIIDDINLPKHCMHYVIIPELILCSADVALVLPHMLTIISHLKMINDHTFLYSLALIAGTLNYNFHIM